MKRKVIQIADSTQLISLPRKWTIEHGIKKGDELDVEESGNKIIIHTEKIPESGSIEKDISNLDRDSLMFLIRCLYIRGYDEIRLKFDKQTTHHYKAGKEVTVISAIHEEVNRLNGAEIIEQKENYCVIKDLSEGTIKEFDSVLRRIFLLLIDANNDLIEGVKRGDYALLDTINEKHNTVTKFAAYDLRLLNKFGYTDSKKTTSLYGILSSVDMIIDIITYCARYIINNKLVANTKIKLSKESIAILSTIHNALKEYHEFFYNFNLEKMEKLSANRSETLEKIRRTIKTFSNSEILILTSMEQIFEIIIHMAVSRVAMEY